MLSRRASLGLSVVMLLALAPAAARATSQNESTTPQAFLDGLPLPIWEVSGYHCHDLALPDILCFVSEEARDAAVDLLNNGELSSATTTSSSGYVIAYVHASYAGTSVVLSQDYSNLGSIGWNDIISSYKVYTSPNGQFYEHTWYGGRYQTFCCFTNVPYVGDPLNDTFSSFNLP